MSKQTTTQPTNNYSITNEWKFQQAFGDSKSMGEHTVEADIISAVEFDTTGDYLAIGDKGGRVVILERNVPSKKKVEYKVMTEFQSHEPEFDYLKSLEIEEKINQIRWLPRHNHCHFLLTTNDKTIKMWKVYSKPKHSIIGTNFINGTRKGPLKNIKIPTIQKDYSNTQIIHQAKRVYSNAHAYHINSISLNSDGETFLSSDDLRINLWNLSYPEESLTFVDIKPENMEDLTEVITSASFHPLHCNTFLYSSSKGTIKLGDMRQSAQCHSLKTFEMEEDVSSKTFFSEIIASISDAKFSRDGNFILSRDYMTLKIWDIRIENRPIKILNVHEPLRSKLCDLYENDCIFDKFECCFSFDGEFVVTGSYKNYFHIFDRHGKTHCSIEASRIATATTKRRVSKSNILSRKTKKSPDEIFENADFSKKCLHLAMHPRENITAVAAVNNLYIFANCNRPTTPTSPTKELSNEI